MPGTLSSVCVCVCGHWRKSKRKKSKKLNVLWWRFWFPSLCCIFKWIYFTFLLGAFDFHDLQNHYHELCSTKLPGSLQGSKETLNSGVYKLWSAVHHWGNYLYKHAGASHLQLSGHGSPWVATLWAGSGLGAASLSQVSPLWAPSSEGPQSMENIPPLSHQMFTSPSSLRAGWSFITPFMEERIACLHLPTHGCFPPRRHSSLWMFCIKSGDFFFLMCKRPSLSIYPTTWGISGASPLLQSPDPNSYLEMKF